MFLRKCFMILFPIVLIFSGLLINFTQLICYLIINPINRNLFKKMNGVLRYSLWSQLVTFLQFSNLKIRAFYANEETEVLMGKEHALFIANHTYEIDWIIITASNCYHGCLANMKAVAKKALKNIPIFGWCYRFDNWIFLDRDWKKDKDSFGPILDDYLDGADEEGAKGEDAINLTLLSEGTRFTKEKHEASIEYAHKIGVKAFKHHLFPRTRGFVAIIQHLKIRKRKMAIINGQIAFSPKLNGKRLPKLSTIIKGQPLICDLYLERIDMDTIDCTNEESISKFLINLYREKDKLVEHHQKNGIFPGKMIFMEPKLLPVINWIFWLAIFTKVASTLIFTAFSNGSYGTLILICAILFGILKLFDRLCEESTIGSGSNYGVSKDSVSKDGVSSNDLSKRLEENNNVTRL